MGFGAGQYLQYGEQSIEPLRVYPAFFLDQRMPQHGDLGYRPPKGECAEPQEFEEQSDLADLYRAVWHQANGPGGFGSGFSHGNAPLRRKLQRMERTWAGTA